MCKSQLLFLKARSILSLDTTTVNVSVHYDPAAVGKLRMHITMRASLEQLKLMGFTEKDTDDVRRENFKSVTLRSLRCAPSSPTRIFISCASLWPSQRCTYCWMHWLSRTISPSGASAKIWLVCRHVCRSGIASRIQSLQVR